MSGIDTDSDSDGNDNVGLDNQSQQIDIEEPIETPYIPMPEDEINTVSLQYCFKIDLITNIFN